MVTYGGHDGQIGRHKFRFEKMYVFIMIERAYVHLVAYIHYQADIFLQIAVFLIDFSFGSLHQPFVSAPAFYLVIAHNVESSSAVCFLWEEAWRIGTFRFLYRWNRFGKSIAYLAQALSALPNGIEMDLK